MLFPFASFCLSSQPTVVRLPASPTYAFSEILECGASVHFLLPPNIPYQFLFQEIHDHAFTIVRQLGDGFSSTLFYSAANFSSFLSVRSMPLIESITVTAQSTARLAFTLFNFDCLGHIFVTNALSEVFRIWNSFGQFRCATKSSIYIFFNVSVPYFLSSTQSTIVVSQNETFAVAADGERALSAAALAVFEALPCSSAVDIAIQSNSTQTEPVVSQMIPDPLLPDYQVPNIPPSAAPTEASGPSVFFGIGLSLAMTLMISAGLFVRSVIRDRRAGRRPWKKPKAAVQPPNLGDAPAEPLEQAAADVDFVPAPCDVDLDLDQAAVAMGSDRCASDSEAFGQGLPESPYDTENGIC
jgi:hypothetical protein